VIGTAGSRLNWDAGFTRQLEYCQYEIMEGPGKIMRWSVPDAPVTRHR
jgi:hypothetical protein